jgi:hypothetical protein
VTVTVTQKPASHRLGVNVPVQFVTSTNTGIEMIVFTPAGGSDPTAGAGSIPETSTQMSRATISGVTTAIQRQAT